jgi:hypothetical protein
MKQIAYTATFGGGFSATLALEDSKDMNNNQVAIDRLNTAAVVVGNLRLDQSWGFAVLHGMVGNNSFLTNSTVGVTNGFGTFAAPAVNVGQTTSTGWAIGGTVNFKLPMLAPGDQLWLTANYAHGMLGATGSTGGLSNVNSTASDKRLLGGLVRVDTNLIPTSATTFGAVNSWNVAAAFTHYWASNWRSNFTTGYVEINPPTAAASAGTQWGKGRLWEVAGSLVYSPAKDFDIGLEVQYANLKSNLQNAPLAYIAAGSPGLSVNNWSTKLRVERSF